jgi:hypothetical protein
MKEEGGRIRPKDSSQLLEGEILEETIENSPLQCS